MSNANLTSETVTSTMWRLHSWESKIEPFRVLKQTACFVNYLEQWCGKTHERRERKEGQWFDSWEAAHTALLNKARGAVEQSKTILQMKRTALGMVESMRKPT